ncbi:hypothetical protein PVAG01_07738 [Phlyctema vagabunda]|uniref:XRCC4 coiled-coil domain-containing protein n=1 Tax=Phlyctema vagabunda TaxID=108571 RepID=A0ABR4PD97_9HELO
MSQRVLRLPRVDGPADEPAYVLVHISSTKNSEPLDISLVGTENSSVYVASFKRTQTATLRAKSFKGSPEEWNQILGHVLLGRTAAPNLLDGIEVVATVKASKLNINIRKRIEGITQRFGTIELAQDDSAEDDFNGFEWCALALESTNTSFHELESLSTKVKEQEDAIQKLESKFEELVQAKANHEDELLQKFSALLNEKKLKIRDQQRLLASAKIDPAKLAEVKATRQPASKLPASSRTGKRKAAVPGDDEELDDGFEKMDVDAAGQVTDDSEREPPVTPDPGSETESDNEDEQNKQPLSSVKAQPATDTTDDKPPPPRALPFGRRAVASKPSAASKPTVDTGSETESDDEL